MRRNNATTQIERRVKMERKAIRGMMLILLLAGTLAITFNVVVVTAGQEVGRLLIETDKSVYALGEEVNITITNIGEIDVEIGGWPCVQIYTYPDLEPVWPCIFAFLAWNLTPGESESWIWNQYNEFTNKSAELGTYVVNFTGPYPMEVTEAFFEIALSRSVLMQRISEIDAQWVYTSSEDRKTLFRELIDIDDQWAYAPP